MTSKTDPLIHPDRLGPDGAGKILSVNPQRAGWRHVSFGVHPFRPGDRLSTETGDGELALLILAGQCDVESASGTGAQNVGGKVT